MKHKSVLSHIQLVLVPVSRRPEQSVVRKQCSPCHLISPKSDVNEIWYSQHCAGAFPLDPEVRGVIHKLHLVVGLVGSNPRGVNLKWDFKPLPVGVI